MRGTGTTYCTDESRRASRNDIFMPRSYQRSHFVKQYDDNDNKNNCDNKETSSSVFLKARPGFRRINNAKRSIPNTHELQEANSQIPNIEHCMVRNRLQWCTCPCRLDWFLILYIAEECCILCQSRDNKWVFSSAILCRRDSLSLGD